MNSILLACSTFMCMPTLKSSPRQSCLLMSHVFYIYPMCSYTKETFILHSPNVCCGRHILQLFKCLFEFSLHFSILQITGKCFPACWSTVCPFYPILLTRCLYIPGNQSVKFSKVHLADVLWSQQAQVKVQLVTVQAF